MLNFLRTYLSRRERLALMLPEFAHKHKDLLIIVADPKTDEIYVHYKDHLVRGQIGDKVGGKNQKIVANMLKFGRFPTVAEKFLLELQASLRGYHKQAKFFFAGLFDSLYAVARANTYKKTRSND